MRHDFCLGAVMAFVLQTKLVKIHRNFLATLFYEIYCGGLGVYIYFSFV